VPITQGKWVKIAVSKQGMYQITGSQLKAWGFAVPFASNQLQLFNYNTANLVEKNSDKMAVGLFENSIDVLDGNDKQFDSQDYFLFYSQGNVQWHWNIELQKFEHNKNLHGDSIYYFITLGKDGKRIQKLNSNLTATENVDSFNDHWLIEKDSINILNSGQLWCGSPMGIGSGKQSKISSTLNMEGLDISSELICKLNYAAASTISPANFDLLFNDQKIRNTIVSPISGFVYDDAVNIALDTFRYPLNAAMLNTNLASLNLTINYLSANSNSTGWINYIQLQGKRKLGFYSNKSFGFTNTNDFGIGKVVQYQIKDADATTKVWDVTQPENPIELNCSIQNGQETSYKWEIHCGLFLVLLNWAMSQLVLLS